MMLVGRFMKYIEARTLIISGLALMSLSLFFHDRLDRPDQCADHHRGQHRAGFWFGGWCSLPLSTVAFLTLPIICAPTATSMLTLMRNVASSIGISVVIAQLTEGGRRVYAILSEHINPFNQALQMPDVRGMIDLNSDGGRALADAVVGIQAQIIAFALDYQMVMIITLCAIR